MTPNEHVKKVIGHYCPKPTKKSWFSTKLAAFKIEDAYNYGLKNSCWSVRKVALLHQDCSDSVTERGLSSPVWYERLTAGLAKHKRNKFVDALLKDADVRVRAAAYKTALAEGLRDARDLAAKILAEKDIHSYFQNGIWNLGMIDDVARGMGLDDALTKAEAKFSSMEG